MNNMKKETYTALQLAKELIELAQTYGDKPVYISLLGNSDNLELPINDVDNWGSVFNVEFSFDSGKYKNNTKQFKRDIKKIDDWTGDM